MVEGIVVKPELNCFKPGIHSTEKSLVDNSALSPTGVCVHIFDDIKAYSHGRHGYRPSSPQRFRLQLWKCLIVHHEQLLAVQLDMSAERRQEIQTALVPLDSEKQQLQECA